jgi:ribosomal protein S24E
MKLNILNETENPLLGRTEYRVEITGESSPTKEAFLNEMGKDVNLCDVQGFESGFGKEKFIVNLMVYNDLESKNKFMTIPKKIRAKMEEERKKAEEEAKKKAEEEKKAAEEAAKAEAEAEEAPVEEKTEETPAEEEKTEEVKEEAKE